jgi:hypothetical protein
VFVALAIIFAIVWVVAFILVKVSSVAIHVLLALALVSVVAHLFRHGRKRA